MNLTLIRLNVLTIFCWYLACSGLLAQSIHEYRQQVASLMVDFRWEEALQVARIGLEQFPADSDLLVAAGALSMKLGETSESARLISRALEQPRVNPTLLGILADLKLAGGDSGAAVALYEKALEAGNDQALLRYRLARALLERGREEEALESSARAVELEGQNPKYRRF